jgi:YVTN family beta-propeller protein
MALVVNQDDTTLTTLRLDGKNSPVMNTLPLGTPQSDSIGGVTFSLGEWIFVTHMPGNRVAFIDPIGALTPILEGYLDASDDPRVGLRPKRIYRDPTNKEVLWVMNEGDAGQGGVDTTLCTTSQTGSYTILHNSHLSVGGTKPHIVTTQCLPVGTGEAFLAFSRPTLTNPDIPKLGFISTKATGKIALVENNPASSQNQYRSTSFLNLCDDSKEACDPSPISTAPNGSAPAGVEWSDATGKIYVYLSGYRSIVEIDPAFSFGPGNTFPWPTGRKVDLTGMPFTSFSIALNGRLLFLVGEDVTSDPTKVLGKFGVVRLDTPLPTDPLTVAALAIPELDNIRPAQFKFTPDGKRLYLTQSNSLNSLPFAAQAHNLKLDKLLVFDLTSFPAALGFVAEIDLPAAVTHGLDVWSTGPKGSGSAKAILVTNATPGVHGSVSLIDAASNTITTTIPVGRNPKQVTIYYAGLAASDNQATPIW